MNRFLHFSFPRWKLSTVSLWISAASPQARLPSDDSNNASPSLQMEHFDGLCSVNLHRTVRIWINVDLRYTERWGQHVKVIHNSMQMLFNFQPERFKTWNSAKVPRFKAKLFFMFISFILVPVTLYFAYCHITVTGSNEPNGALFTPVLRVLLYKQSLSQTKFSFAFMDVK